MHSHAKSPYEGIIRYPTLSIISKNCMWLCVCFDVQQPLLSPFPLHIRSPHTHLYPIHPPQLANDSSILLNSSSIL